MPDIQVLLNDGKKTVLRGVAVHLLGRANGGCISPVRIGPDTYPDTAEVTYTRDACREEFNLEKLGELQASAPGEIVRIPVQVTFPDGSPTYSAQVLVLGQRPLAPIVVVFQTDRTGHVALPIPLNQEFTVDAACKPAAR